MRHVHASIASLLTVALFMPNLPAQDEAKFSTTANIVILNVTVLGKDGKPIKTLKKSDFQVYEDGKLQQLQSADLQELNGEQLPPLTVAVSGSKLPASKPVAPVVESKPPTTTASRLSQYQDRRLIVMLFDFSSMEVAEQGRTRDAALKFLSTQMTSSDMVSLMVFGNQLQTVQPFTADRDLLIKTINGFRAGQSSEQASMADTGADAEDQSGSFVADETEFNIFNTDRKLAALEEAARKLAVYPEKKALVYFSSGVQKTGVDNQSQLRATVNAAVRANVAFYPIDARGLMAMAPGGGASQAGSAGSGLFSGAGQRTVRDSFQNAQESLYTLASDTGGKALLDSNDLTLGITQVQRDINSYYILGYASSNPKEDGRYRRIQIKLAPQASTLKAKLDYRQGYFAPTTFTRLNETDKEAQLQRALSSDNPITDLPLAMEIDYFRLEKAKYFVPLTVKIPGSALVFQKKGSKNSTELDFVAEIRDKQGRAVSAVRDTIPLKLDETATGKVTTRQVQYDTGVTLAPGTYRVKFVARENGEGKTGTFESSVVIPDLSSGSSLRLSSLILSNQVQASGERAPGAKADKKLLAADPLIDESGHKLIPNVTKAFRTNQSLNAFAEIYDPAVPEGMPTNLRLASVVSRLALYQGQQLAFQSQPVRGVRFAAKRDGVVPLRLQLSLKDVPPGQYVCQLDVIDEIGRKFAFPRVSIVVLPQLKETSPSD